MDEMVAPDGDHQFADASFRKLFEANYGWVVALASRICGDRQIGEEIAQDAFVALTRQLEIGPVDQPAAWLRTVALRRAINAQRQARRVRDAHRRLPPAEEVVGPLEEEPDPELAAALSQLSGRQRAAVLLVFAEQYSAAEAARIIGCSPATVRVHLHRARAVLRESLSGRESQPVVTHVRLAEKGNS